MRAARVVSTFTRFLDFLAFGREAERRAARAERRADRRLAQVRREAARAQRDVDVTRERFAEAVARAIAASEEQRSVSIPPAAMTTIRPPSIFDLEEFAKDISK